MNSQRNDFLLIGCTLLICSSTACTTALQARLVNSLTQPLQMEVLVNDVSKLTKSVPPGTSAGPEIIGKYSPGSRIELRASLPTGGTVQSEKRELPSQRDAYTLTTDVKSIPALALDPSDSETIERQITDITGSNLAPTDDIAAFVKQNLGGIYRMKTEKGVEIFERLIDPTKLGAAVTMEEFMPSSGPKPVFDIKITTDQASAAKLKAGMPEKFNLSLDFTSSAAYKYEFHVEAGWRSTPKSWFTIQSELSKSEQGKQLLTIIETFAKQYGKIYYLDQGYVMNRVHQDTYQARHISANANITVENFLSGGVAYDWAKDQNASKDYQNLLLRVRYSELIPFVLAADGTLTQVVPGRTNATGFTSTDKSKPGQIKLVSVPHFATK